MRRHTARWILLPLLTTAATGRAPEAHRQFLLSLGIPEDEALFIRQWSTQGSEE